ncbi:SDR family oxidoreductase [Paenibacillus sp. R14(2021)]|uniref:SDR family oxidoreductase n=1 Tax=Paenibacillus sp. R14(2021) TaxID=2859228 RepID=UPI001C6131FA|nr:SDR family oxidoreductase [Paenibacillus sp. R14(2021)]
MKVVIIGGTGLIGKQLTKNLREQGHEAVQASPSLGINSITGEGLTEAFKGADVVVDVTNSPSWEDQAVLEFFETSTRNLLAAEAEAGVKHHVALSIVNTDLLPENGYFRAKTAQEVLIKSSKIPYTIVRATQFSEFVGGIVDMATEGQTVTLSSAFFQPITSGDVAAALADFALAPAANATFELAGPDRYRLNEIARIYLKAKNDARQVVTDENYKYFGSVLKELSLVPHDNSKARIAPTHFEDWLRSASQA